MLDNTVCVGEQCTTTFTQCFTDFGFHIDAHVCFLFFSGTHEGVILAFHIPARGTNITMSETLKGSF